jgi:hypothetical protein
MVSGNRLFTGLPDDRANPVLANRTGSGTGCFRIRLPPLTGVHIGRTQFPFSVFSFAIFFHGSIPEKNAVPAFWNHYIDLIRLIYV